MNDDDDDDDAKKASRGKSGSGSVVSGWSRGEVGGEGVGVFAGKSGESGGHGSGGLVRKFYNGLTQP